MLRGTLRRPGFSKAWDVFVQLGMTDDSFELSNVSTMTCREFINSFLEYDIVQSVESKVQDYLSLDKEVMDKLIWLGLFENKKIGLDRGTPAQVLQHILESKWSLKADDKDMIVMQHLFEYTLGGKDHKLKSSLVLRGKDQTNTAMSMTVGLPVAIAAELILTDKINMSGVKIPIDKEIYLPVLEKLKEFGIDFVEEEVTD
jgi:saccharopine dehydrogenase (NADP+, L-glutamate forming)